MAEQGERDNKPKTIRVAKWVPIVGTWLTEFVDPSKTVFTGCDDDSFKAGLALSEVRATSAVVRANVRIGKADDGIVRTRESDGGCGRIVFGYNSADSRGFSAGIGGYGQAFVLDEYVLSQHRSWLIRGVGKKQNLRADIPYAIEVDLRGNNVRLSVDGVQVFQHNLPHPLLGDQVGLMAFGDGEVSFTDVEVMPARPRAFVVMQFTEPYNSLWEEVIKPVAERVGFEAYRADDVFGPGVVLQDIVQGISTSQAIIAEITPRNPNVYYELGYAHALGTPTVLLAEHPKEGGASLPFDVNGFRCIFYDDAIRGKRRVETALEKHLRNILERSKNGGP